MEKTIIDLETKFWDAIKHADTAGATALLHTPSLVAGAQGAASLTPEDYKKMAEQPGWKLNSYKLSDIKVNFPAENIAIIAYKVSEDLDVEGKPLQLNAADVSVWVKANGQWLNAAHTESILGDPFGRDRKQ